MQEKVDLIELNHCTTVQYKAHDGSIKELRVIQPLDPEKRKFDLKDMQLLAREIAKVLKEDAL